MQQLRICLFHSLLDKIGCAIAWRSEDVDGKLWQEIVAKHMASLPNGKDLIGNGVLSADE